MKKEFERRMNPKTKEDFDLLYHTLESESFTSVLDSCLCDGIFWSWLCTKFDEGYICKL